MQPARLDRTLSPNSVSTGTAKATAAPGPTSAQAAAYIYDMATTLRNLASQHNLATLALLLEMAAVEASSTKPPHA